jgi:hypothetical protein
VLLVSAISVCFDFDMSAKGQSRRFDVHRPLPVYPPENGHTTDPYLGSAPCPLRKHRDDHEVGKLPPAAQRQFAGGRIFPGSGVW